ncbi:MAG: hypothetical protein QM520_06720 [Gammaproteobacteria bacterium]|nr:hypothetical protein [Gammaproteobacteria bacterium]
MTAHRAAPADGATVFAMLLPAKLHATINCERSLAKDVLDCGGLHLVFHIEQNNNAMDMADIYQKLRPRLQCIDAKFKIVNMQKINKREIPTLDWRVDEPMLPMPPHFP